VVDLNVVLVEAISAVDGKVVIVSVVDVDAARVVVVLVKYMFVVDDVVVVSVTVSVVGDTVEDVEGLALLISILLIVVKIGFFSSLQNFLVKSSKSKAHFISPLKHLHNI
jgi:hypothetical protein